MSKEESDFRNSLENELHKFNTFFVEKEEECIIRLKDFAKKQGVKIQARGMSTRKIASHIGEAAAHNLLESWPPTLGLSVGIVQRGRSYDTLIAYAEALHKRIRIVI